jgi:ubiquinol-cytochrome c reductase iron-sulfur subunit
MNDDRPSSLAPGGEDYVNDPVHYGIYDGEEWPDDVPRNQDDTHWRFEDDPAGARKAELKIAACWMVTLLCGLGLAVTYCLGGQPQAEGSLLCVGFGGLGVGLIMWARDLLPGHEVTASRGHHSASPESARAAVVQSLGRGLEPIARRPFLGKVLGLVGGVFGVAVFFPLASLGPRPHRTLESTPWGKDTRLVNEDGDFVKPDDVVPNGILTVFPYTHPTQALDSSYMAQSATILINLGSASSTYKPAADRNGWDVPSGDGTDLVAFSKICTHAGCPVGLYNTIAHQLVCPCHQSTFDVLSGCKPVFGPASRPLPQLNIGVDEEGYLVSKAGYDQPVGPGFWNR